MNDVEVKVKVKVLEHPFTVEVKSNLYDGTLPVASTFSITPRPHNCLQSLSKMTTINRGLQ